jgi:putative oligomerization/nucleic acid binding protein
MRGVARTAAVVGTATAVSGRVSHRQANRWAAQDEPQSQQQMASQPPPPPAAADQPVYAPPVAAAEQPADDMNGRLDQLAQLGALKEQGILSEAEFEAQKAKILAG